MELKDLYEEYGNQEEFKGSLSTRARSFQTNISEQIKSCFELLDPDRDREDNQVCCDFGYLECLDSASMPFMSNFIKGCTIKILLELISKRSFKHLY